MSDDVCEHTGIRKGAGSGKTTQGTGLSLDKVEDIFYFSFLLLFVIISYTHKSVPTMSLTVISLIKTVTQSVTLIHHKDIVYLNKNDSTCVCAGIAHVGTDQPNIKCDGKSCNN